MFNLITMLVTTLFSLLGIAIAQDSFKKWGKYKKGGRV